MRRNSVLEGLRQRRLAVNQEWTRLRVVDREVSEV